MEKKTHLVSILMPCYNSEKYVLEAITSIKNQTYINWELLICDDKSTDDSLNILKKLESEKIIIFQNQENQGYLKTCNFLFTKCKGDFITFQDSDDYSSPFRIENLITEFINNNNLGACGTQFNFITDNGVKLTSDSPQYPLNHSEILDAFLSSPPFCGASVMIDSRVLKSIGLYNDYWDRIGAEDHYWLFLIAEKYEVANIDKVQYYYRHNPNSVTRNKSNPRKIHCHDFLMHFFSQRINTGSDDLELGNLRAINEMEKKHLLPYEQDPTYIYKRLIDWAYSDKNFRSVFKNIFQALKTQPFSLYWYKTLVYYLRKIYL